MLVHSSEQPPEQQRRTGPDNRGPALLDVGVSQLEADLTAPLVGVVDRVKARL